MAAVGEEPSDVEAAGFCRGHETCRVGGCGDSSAVAAAVDLDHHVQRLGGSLHRAYECGDAFLGVDADCQPYAIMQMPQPLASRCVGVHRIGDEQVLDPGVGEDLGLTDRADGEPASAGVELELRDLDALVGLGMRPQRHARAIHGGLHRGHVGPQNGAIDDGGGGWDGGWQVRGGMRWTAASSLVWVTCFILPCRRRAASSGSRKSLRSLVGMGIVGAGCVGGWC